MRTDTLIEKRFVFRLFTVVLGAAASLIPAVAQQTGRAPSSSDEQAIRAVVRDYMDARNHTDAKAIEALFTTDADQLVSSGEWRKGRKNVVQGTLRSSQASGGKRTIRLESIRMLRPDVALADGRYELTELKDGGTRRMWTSLVLTREAGQWRIAAIRNMLPAPPAGSR